MPGLGVVQAGHDHTGIEAQLPGMVVRKIRALPVRGAFDDVLISQ